MHGRNPSGEPTAATGGPTAAVAEAAGSYPGPGGGYPLRDWYDSPAVHELERERLFMRSWALVADAGELAAAGAYRTATVAGAPLLVLRDGGGNLRAFHNLCRHRGVVLVEGGGTLDGSIVCPYHAWDYGLDGELRRIPQSRAQFPDVDPGCWGLLPASVDEWHGMVFASPTPGLPPVREAFGDLAHRLEAHLRGELVQVARVDDVVACNWKFIVENHLDIYHLWYLHRSSLGAYDHPNFDSAFLGPNWWSNEQLRRPAEAPDALPWLTGGLRTAIGAHLLFPNLMLVTTGDYVATYDATPLDPGHTSLTLRVRAPRGADGGELVERVRSFLAEDVEVCRRLQDAVRSPAFSIGPLAATHEATLLTFHDHLRRALGLAPSLVGA